MPRWLVEDPDTSHAAVRAFALLTRYANLPQGAMPALGTLAEAIGVSRDTMRRALYELRDRGVVVIEPRADGRGQTSNRYHLRYHPPSTHAPPPHSNGATGPPSSAATGPPSTGATRKIQTGSDTDGEGDNTTPPPAGAAVVAADPTYSNEVVELTREFAQLVKANGHKLPAKGTKAAATWLKQMDLLVRRGAPGDGEDPTPPDEIRATMRWALQVSDFWPANIRAVPKFREQYTTLRAQAQRPNGRAAPGAKLAGAYEAAAANLRSRS